MIKKFSTSFTISRNDKGGNTSLKTCRDVSGALAHNLRSYGMYDAENTKKNIILIGADNAVDASKDFKSAILNELEEPLEKYNANQTRYDRLILDPIDYFEKKKGDIGVEIICSIGNKKYWEDLENEFTKDRRELYTVNFFKHNFLDIMKKEFPNFKIISAVVHYDEVGAPHVQVVGIPFTYGKKKGISVGISKAKTFTRDKLAKMSEIIGKSYEDFINIGTQRQGLKTKNGVVLKYEYQKAGGEKRDRLSTKKYIEEQKLKELEKEEENLKNSIKDQQAKNQQLQNQLNQAKQTNESLLLEFKKRRIEQDKKEISMFEKFKALVDSSYDFLKNSIKDLKLLDYRLAEMVMISKFFEKKGEIDFNSLGWQMMFPNIEDMNDLKEKVDDFTKYYNDLKGVFSTIEKSLKNSTLFKEFEVFLEEEKTFMEENIVEEKNIENIERSAKLSTNKNTFSYRK